MSKLLRDTEVLRDAKRALREGRSLPNAAELARIADALGHPRLAAELRARVEAT